MTTERAAGDPFVSGAGTIQVRVAELKQLFDSMDPAPFHNRDVDPRAEDYIVSWSRELPRDQELALLVHLDRPAGLPDEAVALRNAIHQFFKDRSAAAGSRLKQLFRVGRISLLIGLAFLAGVLAASELIQSLFHPSGFLQLVHESLVIGGWVAMWRPIEIFLYDWWPILGERRLYERLAAMPVRIKYGSEASSDAWQRDWPAVAPTHPAATPSGPSR